MKKMLRICAISLLAVLLFVILHWFYIFKVQSPVPGIKYLRNNDPKTTALIEHRRRQAEKKGRKFAPLQVWVSLDDVSPFLRDAIIATEDERFFTHKGIEWRCIREAFLHDLKVRRFERGGSTITQQLAKNLFLRPSKNIYRKLLELIIAKELEKELSKERIFEIYLNIIETGRGMFGVEAASQKYFGKPAGELDLEESVLLTAVIPSPIKHMPVETSRWLEIHRDWVVKRMKETKRYPEGYEGILISTAAVAGQEEELFLEPEEEADYNGGGDYNDVDNGDK